MILDRILATHSSEYCLLFTCIWFCFPLDEKARREGVFAESPLPGQIENGVDRRSSVNSSIVRPGSAASITGPTPGVSPIQKPQQDQPSQVVEAQGGFSSTPHPGLNSERILTPRPGSITSSGHSETVTPEWRNSPTEPDESVVIGMNTTGQSEV